MCTLLKTRFGPRKKIQPSQTQGSVMHNERFAIKDKRCVLHHSSSYAESARLKTTRAPRSSAASRMPPRPVRIASPCTPRGRTSSREWVRGYPCAARRSGTPTCGGSRCSYHFRPEVIHKLTTTADKLNAGVARDSLYLAIQSKSSCARELSNATDTQQKSADSGCSAQINKLQFCATARFSG